MKKIFLFSFVAFFLACAIIFPYVQWYADNPDTFQYLSIAAKYASGDWSHALNGYWSPMISWLLAIPLVFSENQILCFKILQVVIGAFTLFQWTRLVNKTSISSSIQKLLIAAAIPFLIYYSLLNLTPDLLFLGVLLTLINQLVSGNIFSDKKTSIILGITGALLFLTKAFGFPFFVAITFIIILYERKSRLKIQTKNLFLMYGIFLLISMMWIIPLSIRFGHFTISEAPQFNMSVDAAPLPNRSPELPILGKGLLTPQPNSISAWETPGDFVSAETISLFRNPWMYFQIIKRNLSSIYYFDFSHQVGAVFFFLLLMFSVRPGFRELINERWKIILLSFIILFYAGYSLILVHARYTWINNFLMLLMSVYFIQQIFGKNFMKRLAMILSVAVVLLAVKRPVKEIFYTADGNFPVGWFVKTMKHPFQTLWIFYKPDHQLQRSLKEIQAKKIISGNVASLKKRGTERDSYTNALRIAMGNDCKYFGQLDDGLALDKQSEELNRNDIDFLITWKNTDWVAGRSVYSNAESGIRVYAVK